MARIVVANQFGGQMGALLRAHPLEPEVIDLPFESRWQIPARADCAFVVHGWRDASLKDGEAPLPAGWPGATRWVQLASAGLDDYPRWLFDVPQLTNARGTTAHAIAEYVLAVMLANVKQIPGIFVDRADAWPTPETRGALTLGTLSGATLGLIGLGAIGARVADLGRAFGMRVLAARRSNAPGPDGVEIRPLGEVLAAADHLVIAAPFSEETKGMVDARFLAQLKPGCHLVNVSRGGMVDQAALLAALESGHLGAATLDVTEPEPLPTGDPLYAHPRVRISPHISYSAPGVINRVVALFHENLVRFAQGQELLNLIPPEDRVIAA
ncbi:NAD(P)-dependent oxidoreductase [Zavarzinia sp. CC-PAN008]|uniref:NAD(P)-dependent oxidoreductase n=1 Tax=Zavarzinia sp. CC-PAN008 TaxID=3243332 RepID=UPI003F742DBF